MKTCLSPLLVRLLPLLGVLLGSAAAFLIFAVLFNTPTARIFPQILTPLGLAAAASLALSWLSPSQWKMLSAAVALPTLLMAAFLFIALWGEGRGDWSWPLVAIAVLSVCFPPGWLVSRIARRRVHI